MLRKELKGWDNDVLNMKISQLSKIIAQINGGAGPDILRVCEVESKVVLEKPVNKIPLSRNYKIAHDNSKDNRGIDITFIYDADSFKLEANFSHFIVKRNATRDLFQVNLRIEKDERLLVLVGNHWPARISGMFDSKPYRLIAGEALHISTKE